MRPQRALRSRERRSGAGPGAPAASRSPAGAQLALPELTLHALAQMPPEVCLELPADPFPLDLGALAAAYGVSDRIGFGGPLDGPRFVAGSNVLDFASEELRDATLGELVEQVAEGRTYQVEPPEHDLLDGHRVLIVTNHPAHYRLPLFDGVTRRLEQRGASFRVEFTGSRDRDRPWLAAGRPTFPHGYTRGVRVPVRRRRPPDFPLDLARRVRAYRPTIVLTAGMSPLVSRRVARHVGPDVVLGIWSGETPLLASEGSPARWSRHRDILRRADFGLAYGSSSAAYLRWLRPDLPLVLGRNTAPVPAVVPARPRRGDGVLELVMVGDLADTRKGVRVALDALRVHRDRNVHLTVIGGGALLDTLRAEAADDPQVRFVGALQPHDVQTALSGADGLLFPTRREFFGLVLVEAMGAGAVPIVSTDAGAVPDLAVDGVNAVVVDGHDPVDWARAIAGTAADAGLRGQIGQRARATIESRWSIPHAADAMLAGFAAGIAARRRQA